MARTGRVSIFKLLVHLTLTFLTGGLWLIVLGIIWFLRSK